VHFLSFVCKFVVMDIKMFHAFFGGTHIKHNTQAKNMTQEEINKILNFHG
jgi:hypothetical protein